jgi:Peptidase family M20/M25/M40
MTDIFFKELVDIVNIPTCFWDEDSIRKAIAHCYEVMSVLPDHWEKRIDPSGNLIVYNTRADLTKPMLYLASHIDMVGAKESDWLTPPFQATETEEYILGRGVNDCKAGTALELTLARMIAKNSEEYNLGFLVMFREEGNSGKTSSNIDFTRMPISKAGTYIITLENTLRLLPDNTYALGIYEREPHNLFITVSGTLSELQASIDSLCDRKWKPVVIVPSVENLDSIEVKEVIQNISGHTATLRNENNKLLQVLKKEYPSGTMIKTGNVKDASVVSPEIFLYEGAKEVPHDLIYNYRDFESIETIKEKLSDISYTETFGFKNGLGSDQSSQVRSSPILQWLKKGENASLKIEVTDNPGRSDASAIFNLLSLEERQYIIPFASGLGCRTHTDKNGVRHATHGENEGFYKPSASVTIPVYLELLNFFRIS